MRSVKGSVVEDQLYRDSPFRGSACITGKVGKIWRTFSGTHTLCIAYVTEIKEELWTLTRT